jgi:hypothetical protein
VLALFARSLCTRSRANDAPSLEQNKTTNPSWAVAATGFVSDFSTHTNAALFASPSFLRHFNLTWRLRAALYYGGLSDGGGGGSNMSDGFMIKNACQAHKLLALQASVCVCVCVCVPKKAGRGCVGVCRVCGVCV